MFHALPGNGCLQRHSTRANLNACALFAGCNSSSILCRRELAAALATR